MKLFAILLLGVAPLTAQNRAAEIVVYGGTSGGVAAAVQAARSQREVVLISPTQHIGGMTTSGLGWTDLGNPAILGGLAREFYETVYRQYQDPAAWEWQDRDRYANRGQGAPGLDPQTGLASVFEPKVAERVFLKMLDEAGVELVIGRLDLEDGVLREGDRIRALRLEGGREISGGMFIDASYEGDLLPGAGVRFTIGRESNATYGESLNGVQTARAVSHQLPDGVDPYRVAGDPDSGLLPGIEPAGGPADGAGDERLQAFCFRMVLTDVPENRLRVEKPDGYDEADYELLFRAIEAGMRGPFFKLSPMPNRKTDSNNDGGVSTDFIGRNHGPGWSWPTLDHDERAKLAEAHERWQRGLLWTLQNHPRVPEAIRERFEPWGLPKDEFSDNGHWPWHLYIRESRRMISDLVMTEAHCTGRERVADSIGLAAYTMDSHHVRRHVVDGMVKNEGDVQVRVPRPYPVSYRAIVPRRGESTNLLVPWSLSASHIAFGSIRMEPVFMILSQSAAVAADMALQENTAVQDVPYPRLRSALLDLGQVLGDPPAWRPAVVVDNQDAGARFSGEWKSSASMPGHFGGDYLHDDGLGDGKCRARFAVPAGEAGERTVFLRWTSHANRAARVPVEIHHAAGVARLEIDQTRDGGQWNAIGRWRFDGGPDQAVILTNEGTEGHVIADAAGFDPEAKR